MHDLYICICMCIHEGIGVHVKPFLVVKIIFLLQFSHFYLCVPMYVMIFIVNSSC